MDRKAHLAASVHALNDQFAEWVKQQQTSKRDELWLDGAQDYISHAKKLLEDFKDGISNSQSTAAAKRTFGTALAVGGGPGLPTANSNDVQRPFAFDKAASTSGFDTYGRSIFNVPQAAGGLDVSANGNGNDTEQEELDKGPMNFQPEVQISDPSADLLFQIAATLFIKTPDAETEWANKGKGSFTLRKPNQLDSERKPCYLVFTTEAGRVLIRAALYRGLQVRKQPKGRILMSLQLAQEVNGQLKTEQHVVLVRMAADKVDEIASKIEDNVPQ